MAYGTVELNPGTGGNTVAVDGIAGSDFQRVKLALGAEGAAVDAVAGAGAVGTGVQRVTLASDDPAVALLTTIDADTGNLAGILTAVQTLDNAIAGNEMQVDIVAGGIAGAAIDTATGATDEGVLSIFTRDDALSTLTPVDGDNVQGRTNARGALWVALDSTVAQTVTLAAGTATNEVVGDAAHGAAAAGNPLLTGLEGRSTAPTAVDDGDVVRALATLLGKQVVLPYALPANTWSYASAAAVTDTADDEAKAAVASTRNYVTGIQVFNGHDTTGTEVVIKDGATVLWRAWAEQTGGGCSAKFDPPLRGTANTAINVANITNSSSTYFNLQGYAAAE